MEQRNSIANLVQAGIPVETRDYSCGCWGKHQPPYIDNSTIIIEIGRGYQSNKHMHGQNLYIIEARDNLALIEVRKYGDLYGSGMWHYLIGVDGAPFIAQISSNINTLDGALESLKPASVKRAESQGLTVERQGDWYFIPTSAPRGQIEINQPLDDDHVATEAVLLKTVAYVRGEITHRQHGTLILGSQWHKAIQNNAIRTGRLAMGGNAD